MLKDKSCYANPRIYAMNYFFHKSEVKDFCIDPMLGSFIRVITPPADMPKEASELYKKPQFMFMTRSDRSRLYELKDARALVEAVYNLRESIKDEHPTFIPMTIKDRLDIEDTGVIKFKDVDGRFQPLLMSPPRPNWDRGINNDMLTLQRYIDGLDKLLHGLSSTYNNESSQLPVIQVGKELMFTMRRLDQKVTVPLIVTARKFPGRKDHYIIMHSNNQRILFPVDKAVEMFDKYFERIIRIGESLVYSQDLHQGCVDFITDGPDGNMEYVNIRNVNFESGVKPHVLINSDRYPGNTKFSYIYEYEFTCELRDRLIDLANRFKEMGNEEASSDSITD